MYKVVSLSCDGSLANVPGFLRLVPEVLQDPLPSSAPPPGRSSAFPAPERVGAGVVLERERVGAGARRRSAAVLGVFCLLVFSMFYLMSVPSHTPLRLLLKLMVLLGGPKCLSF